MKKNKHKIINDPVFGFITIQSELLYDLIQHPYFQRLNRIKQLGLAFMVYPGAQHTRFQHSLGAMFLMGEAIKNLRAKGVEITQDEAEGALVAILLHDLGHGPFSHTLEELIIDNIHHEQISLFLIKKMNEEMNGRLNTALQIFKDEYPKHFLHQLVSGQLDTDRLDYLRRDSFFTGVVEGNIGSARIIQMLNVKDGMLMLESKGIYSIEQYLIARRLMYWQVYFHKTCVAAEKMLTNTLKRAKELALNGKTMNVSSCLDYFLKNKIDKSEFFSSPEAYKHYTELDDNDIWCALKNWINEDDLVLSKLSDCLLNRKLFKTEISTTPWDKKIFQEKCNALAASYKISEHEAAYFITSAEVSTKMYDQMEDDINVFKNNKIQSISESSDILSSSVLSNHVVKYYFSYLRE